MQKQSFFILILGLLITTNNILCYKQADYDKIKDYSDNITSRLKIQGKMLSKEEIPQDETCPICLDTFDLENSEDKIIQLPLRDECICGHTFHLKCLQEYRKNGMPYL